MTSLNPSHFPVDDANDYEGQATISSISPIHALPEHPPHEHHHHAAKEARSEQDADHVEPQAGPSWKGAWARRQAAKAAEKEEKEEETRRAGRIPVPQIPDLRYEQGILSSLKPFIHRSAPTPSSSSSADTFTSTSSVGEKGEGKEEVTPAADPTASAQEQDNDDEKKAVEVKAAEKGAMVSAQALTAEGKRETDGDTPDIFVGEGALVLEYSQIAYILLRDQVVWPLLQGVLWGAAGYFLSSVWAWNKQKKAAAPSSKSRGNKALSGFATRVGLSSK